MMLSAAKVLDCLSDKRKMAGLLLWSPFSLAAFNLVKSLIARGVYPAYVIDVGANRGQFARAVRELQGKKVKIVGFEPLREDYHHLCRNFSGDDNARFENFALGSVAHFSEINVNSFSQSSSLLSLSAQHMAAFPTAREVRREAIEVRRLDDLIRKEDVLRPALLKIDVQGFELNVLEGARDVLNRVDHVLIEIGLVQLYVNEPTFEEVDSYLKNAGFKFDAPLSTLWSKEGKTAIQVDALYSRQS